MKKMKKMKIELILPDDMDESWNPQIQKVEINYIPIKGSIINVCNKNGYSQPFVVTGTRTIFKKNGKSKNTRVYLDKCEFPREFIRRNIND